MIDIAHLTKKFESLLRQTWHREMVIDPNMTDIGIGGCTHQFNVAIDGDIITPERENDSLQQAADSLVEKVERHKASRLGVFGDNQWHVDTVHFCLVGPVLGMLYTNPIPIGDNDEWPNAVRFDVLTDGLASQ